MTVIRVEPATLRKAAQGLAQVAEQVRSAGDHVYQETQGAPSYDGQFGPQVASVGAQALAQARSLADRLAELSASLLAKAEAFETVDAMALQGLGSVWDELQTWIHSPEGQNALRIPLVVPLMPLFLSGGKPEPPPWEPPWWAPFAVAAGDAWRWYDENVNTHVYQAMGSLADSLQSIGDPNRNPRMAAFHRAFWDGIQSWQDIGRMYSATVAYTRQAAAEGRWADAQRGAQGLFQENIGLQGAGAQAALTFVWGVVTTPVRIFTTDIPEFAGAIGERSQGLDRGWDVIFTGTMFAGDVSGTYALARPLGLVDRVNALMPGETLPEFRPGIQLLDQYGAKVEGQSVTGVIDGNRVPINYVGADQVDVAGGVSGAGGRITVTSDPAYPGSTSAALYEEIYHAFQRGGPGLAVELEAKAAVAQWITENGIRVNPSPYLSGDIQAYQIGYAQGGPAAGVEALRLFLIRENYPGIGGQFGPGLLYWQNAWRNLATDAWIVTSGMPHAPAPATPQPAPSGP